MKKQLIVFSLLLFILLTLSTVVFADQIELQNGQKLRGNIQNNNLKIKADYAVLSIQKKYINNLNKKNEIFVLRASENNRFSGQLISDIVFVNQGTEKIFSAPEIKSIDFSDNSSFKDNKQVSVNLRNGDFFFASTVDNSISINTSLGSPLKLNYANISSIEYLSSRNIYLVKHSDGSDIKADLSSQKIIVWPAAGEIFELNFEYVKKINFN